MPVNQSLLQRKYNINEEFFDVIDSESKAYFLGFLYADGTISPSRNTILLSLKENDKIILEKLKECINYTGPLKYRIRNPNWKGASKGSKNTWSLHITNKKLRQRLEEIGCTNNKTYKIEFPEIPENLYRHFIRGYFDGDGCLYISKTKRAEWSMIGTYNFLKNIQDIISENLNLSKNKLYSKGELFYLKYGSKKDVKSLQDWLYKDSIIFLDRKFKNLN